MSQTVNLKNKSSPHGRRNKIGRALWAVVYVLLFRPSPKILFGWRRWLLRRFGAKLGTQTFIHNTVRIWAPWNLQMGSNSSLAHDVNCYCVMPIRIGSNTTVSQYSYLCGATHDFEHPRFPLVPKPIIIEDQVWVAADVFVAPGVTIHQGAVVGARSSVFKDVPAWTVVGGNPAREIKKRVLQPEQTKSNQIKPDSHPTRR